MKGFKLFPILWKEKKDDDVFNKSFPDYVAFLIKMNLLNKSTIFMLIRNNTLSLYEQNYEKYYFQSSLFLQKLANELTSAADF